VNVNDKVAVVTGGAQGIGLALCTRFAREGAHVVLSDVGQEAYERQAAPIGALPVAADVSGEEDIANLVSATIARFEIGFTEWLAVMYGDRGIGVSVLCPAAVRTPILKGKEDTPEGRDAITTEQLADIVMEGLAEERFMISTHPWVLDTFAIKARDCDEYVRTLRADVPAAAASTG